MKSKFSNINYPLFGLSKKPKLKYENTKVYVSKNTSWYLLNDTSINCNYINKLLIMENRLKFDYTCRNINELILSKVTWGVDNNCNIYDLTKKEKFKFACRQIVSQTDNYITIDKITYPLKIPNYFSEVDVSGMYAYLVYVDFTWYIINISHFFNEDEQITL